MMLQAKSELDTAEAYRLKTLSIAIQLVEEDIAELYPETMHMSLSL